MLLTMRALTRAARTICYATAVALDRAERATDAAARTAAHERASLLTPVAKAFSTDIGIEVASLGVQVHGGMGFVEETGAAQHYRDARILAIYEGTNGIQAIDLVTRKLPLSGGAAVRAYIEELRGTLAAVNAANDPAFGATGHGSTTRSTASSAPRNGCSARSRTTPTPRSPAPRPISGCSRWRPAAPAWPRRRWRPPASPATAPMPPPVSRWRVTSPKTSRSRPRHSSAPWSRPPTASTARTRRWPKSLRVSASTVSRTGKTWRAGTRQP